MYPEEFAKVYDTLMDDVDYPAWARYYLELAQKALGRRVESVCECGCGTGSMTLEFARQGISVTGLDLSSAMLEIAAEKLRKNGQRAPLICQNMCNMSLHKAVDAIFVPCDGVNYLVQDGNLAQFATRALRYLKPDGVLIFDVSTPDKLFALPGAPWYEDREDITYFWVSTARENCVDMELTFFLRGKDGLYTRFDEEQTQRAYTREELQTILHETGFSRVSFTGNRTMKEPLPGEERWHITAMR